MTPRSRLRMIWLLNVDEPCGPPVGSIDGTAPATGSVVGLIRRFADARQRQATRDSDQKPEALPRERTARGSLPRRWPSSPSTTAKPSAPSGPFPSPRRSPSWQPVAWPLAWWRLNGDRVAGGRRMFSKRFREETVEEFEGKGVLCLEGGVRIAVVEQQPHRRAQLPRYAECRFAGPDTKSRRETAAARRSHKSPAGRKRPRQRRSSPRASRRSAAAPPCRRWDAPPRRSPGRAWRRPNPSRLIP